MFNLFNRNKGEEKEYTFIWYKTMETGGTTHYTKPFRTKVKAKSETEAREKLTKFVLGKMKLKMHLEQDYNKSDISRFQQIFDSFNDLMNKTFGKFQ